MTHLEHVNKHTFGIKEHKKITSTKLVFDTETCYIDKKMLDENYTGDRERKVWCFGLGCMENENVVMGNTLDQFFELCHNIFKELVSKKRKPGIRKDGKKNVNKYINIEVAVFNVGYEISYLQYYLNKKGYSFEIPTLKTDENGVSTTNTNYKEKSFTLTQTENVYYTMEVNSSKAIIRKSDCGKFKHTYRCKLTFWDACKIIPGKLEKAHKFCNNIDKMFNKITEGFDYDTVRAENHIITDIERRYQYNDIYVLRKALIDYYQNGLLNFEYENKKISLSEKLKTSSAISFQSALEITYKDEKKKMQCFNEKFEVIERMSMSDSIKNMENLSYEGGWTWGNPLITNREISIEKYGSSFDINSSYPYQVVNALLPYGQPTIHKKYYKPNHINEVAIHNIGFDYFKPKKEEYALQMIRLGSKNFISGEKETNIPYAYKKHLNMDIMNGNAFIHTNIINDKVITITRNAEEKLATYNMVITSTELDHLLKYYDFGYYTNSYEDKVNQRFKKPSSFNGVKHGTTLLYRAERGYFAEFINHFYNLKTEIKNQMDSGVKDLEGRYNAVKTILNSFYGKFGTRTKRTIDNLLYDEKNGIFNIDRGSKKTNRDKIKDIADELIKEQLLNAGEYEDTYESKNYYKPYASFITANARVYLQFMIMEAVGIENFLYSDTDSFYCKLPKEVVKQNLLNIGVEVHNSNLGAVDNEKNFDRFKTIGAKKYMLYDIKKKDLTCKCAGVPEEAQKLLCKQGMEEFKLGKEVEGKFAKVKCRGGDDLIKVQYIIQDNVLRFNC